MATSRRLSSAFVTVLALLHCGGSLSAEQAANSQDHALVVADVKVLRSLGPLEPEYAGDMPYGSKYEVRLSDITVSKGQLDERSVTAHLTAAHRESVEQGERIYAVLSRKGTQWTVLHWGFPIEVACVPEELALRVDDRQAYTLEERSPNRAAARLCTALERDRR